MTDQWRAVQWMDGAYEVSNLGGVRSTDRTVVTCAGWSLTRKGQAIRPMTNSRGYLRVYVPVAYQPGRGRSALVHRLVAEAFVPNDDGKPCVNHINGNPKDNRAENLEWVTHKENLEHARRIGLMRDKSTPVIATRGVVGEWFPSIQSTRKYGFSPGLVCESIRKIKQRQHKGRTWEYADNGIPLPDPMAG